VSILENTHPFMQEGLAPKWWWQLQVTDYGKPRPVAYNVAIALSQDPALAGAPRYDAFRNQVMLCRPVPWDRHPLCHASLATTAGSCPEGARRIGQARAMPRPFCRNQASRSYLRSSRYGPIGCP